MSKTIAVIGATGSQGGSVARTFLKLAGWKVRAITRNTDSDKAKALASEGAEIISANVDDESSLVKAFEGATAIFAVTNFWEHLFTGSSPEESGVKEAEQAKKLARAASQTSSLEHYIWSTLPGAKALTNGKFPVPHFDYKAEVDDWIRSDLPELHKKTTYLVLGFYPSNLAFFPMLKPFEIPNSYGKWVQIIPSSASALMPVSGDINVTPGLWTRQIIAKPELTKGRNVDIAPELLTFGKMLEIYGEVTGRQTAYIQSSLEDFTNVWGVGGKEIGDQFVFGEQFKDGWGSKNSVSKEELDIKDDEWPSFKQTLEGLKDHL
ncbi:NAD(P)-binding protein [Bimuria novae-zelandiae CBS 107.79]|uniref:NAD(P)-binding protein n=1 Tax=Bimuria novae-zelandiae CBS 107.79 TaxID=1447943 RepID=A0A6A5UME6_9PLEO|nr:NAD(P)-binding protein [Bimuria novae-zelandiae CBS 107.79]